MHVWECMYGNPHGVIFISCNQSALCETYTQTELFWLNRISVDLVSQRLTSTCFFQRVLRTSPTSSPLAARSPQSTRTCGAWPRLRAGGTVRENLTSRMCLVPRTRRPGWSWPSSATGEAQSCSSNTMVGTELGGA